MSEYSKRLRSRGPVSCEGFSNMAQLNQQSKKRCLYKRTSIEITDDKNSNAVLFVFKTNGPFRVFLKIPKGVRIIRSDDLPDDCNIPLDGAIKYLTSLQDSYSIFLFVFHNKIACSKSTTDDFHGVKFIEDCLPNNIISEKMQTENLAGWAFYCLNSPPPATADDSYVFPTINGERTRVIHLKEALKQKYDIMREGEVSSLSISISLFDSATNGYCQFSGGGDLLISDANSTFTIRSSTQSCDTEPSPNNSGDEILDEVIEAKDFLVITESILYQLFANMILASVEIFVLRCETGFYKTKEEVLKVRRLIGYGAIVTGSFWFTFYKVTLDLDEQQVEFTEKIRPGCRPPLGVVKCLDYCIEYFLSKRM